jgi:CAAX amino terminal protease family protein
MKLENFNMVKNNRLELFNSLVFCIGALSVYGIVEKYLGDVFDYIVAQEKYAGISYYMLDMIMCIVCLMFYIPCMYYLKKKDGIAVFDFPKKEMNFGLLTLGACIVTLGVSGITTVWLDVVYSYLKDVPIFKQSIASYEDSWGGIDNEPYIFVFLAVVIFGPILEELMFRGILLNMIAKHFGNVLGVLFSSIAFGVWHMELIQDVYTAFFAVAMAILYVYTRSIMLPIFSHSLFNLLGTLPPSMETTAVSNIIDNLNYIFMLPAMVICILMTIDYKKRYGIDRN